MTTKNKTLITASSSTAPWRRVALLLLASSCHRSPWPDLPGALAERPLGGAPAALDAGQCAAPGGCDAAGAVEGSGDGDDRDGENYGDGEYGDDEEDDEIYNVPVAVPSAVDGDEDYDHGEGYDEDGDGEDDEEEADDEEEYDDGTAFGYRAALSSHFRGRQRGDGGGGITSRLQRHLERLLVARAHPGARDATLAKAGNYSDGTPAGSPQWAGDEGAQRRRDPEYASFGDVLDVAALAGSTWGAASFGDKVPWIASLLHRRWLVESQGEGVPCRTDLLDDHDATDMGEACLMGATLNRYVSVRDDLGWKREEMDVAAEWEILDEGMFLAGNIADLGFGGKFDTVLAEGALSAAVGAAAEGAEEALEKLVSYLKPGGALYLVGTEPPANAEGPGAVFEEMMDALDSAKELSGEHPKRNLSAKWIHSQLARLGLDVFASTLFPVQRSDYDMRLTLAETKELIDELEAYGDMTDAELESYYEKLQDMQWRAERATRGGPVFAGEHTYIIAAEYPSSSDSATKSERKVAAPAIYQPKERYREDTKPAVEELSLAPLAPGTMEEFRWANGDSYDGFSARIGVPPTLGPALTEYIRGLGLWDLMVDTIYNDPMEPDSTRFYNLTSPFGDGAGRNFTFSAKRPGNFYGSDSDMHWFDIADEAAHEDSLRALAKGGFDEVLNAIGTHLGSEHLVSFSIGLLAVTKADKGYVHVDFHSSERRAFNFLYNLHTPGDDPELTVIEEDSLGNFRRGQIKYAPDFGVLNGDDGMHATNECNHRASGDVRITASIFISELQEESLEQVASHDTYYFPFGNEDWIWAQRGRHWNKDGTVSLVNDKGRKPFEAQDEMERCEERVGKNKEKCLVNSDERKLCFKTCGAFMTEDEFRPGEERRTVFGW